MSFTSGSTWEERLGLVEAEQKVDDGPLLSEHGVDRNDALALAEADLDFLAMLAMPSVFTFGFPPVLQAAWLLLKKYALMHEAFPQLALGIPRGHAKTTLVKLAVLWYILFTKKKFILIVGSTAARAEDILADVVSMLNEMNMINLFGNWKMGAEIDRQDLKKFGFRGRNIVLAAIGAKGSLRGLNINNARPDVMVFDDVQTKECSESSVESASLERWIIGTAMKAKSPRGCMFIFCGNMYPGPNSILKKLRENAAWIKFISGAILSDGTALWPELRSIDSLVQELDNDIAMGHPEIFFSEVMNDVDAGINNRVDFNRLGQWNWSADELPQGKFIIIDPATDKPGSDMTAIGYFEVFDATPALREVVEEQLSPGNTIRRALLLALRHNVHLIAIEGVAYQSSLLYWFNEVCKEIGITGIQCVEVHPGHRSKNARIASMLTSLMDKEIILHPEVKSRVTHQIANWNALKRANVDDILDLLTYAPQVIKNFAHLMLTDYTNEQLESSGAKVVENNSAF